MDARIHEPIFLHHLQVRRPLLVDFVFPIAREDASAKGNKRIEIAPYQLDAVQHLIHTVKCEFVHLDGDDDIIADGERVDDAHVLVGRIVDNADVIARHDGA